MGQMFGWVAFTVIGSGLWLVDSAIKAAVLLFIAGLVALSMRRDSAATRHWVWLVAIVAVLVLPLMSAMLPQWRVLPAWVAIPAMVVSSKSNPDEVPLVGQSLASNANETTDRSTQSQALRSRIVAQNEPPVDLPKVDASNETDRSSHPNGQLEQQQARGVLPVHWHAVISWFWGIGSGLLLIRLLAARFMLERIQSQSMVIDRRCRDEEDLALLKSLNVACSQLCIHRRITLLVCPEKNIPIVWGIWRNRLVLPEAARQWSREQLRSVLLHELAHIKRRDALSQLLAQTVCALHWFNPLVWFAAWRLHIERERACDDLVLASGVRASAYAEHLLNVVTGLTSSQWTQACGLAMARSSSLQSRLTAVLNARQNRRSVTSVLLALSVVVSTAIAVPIAMICALDKAVASVSVDVPVDASSANGLPEGLERHLEWSEPIGGLRGALMIRSLEGSGILGKERRIFLVVQNVSDQPIRLCDTDIHETDVPAAEVEGEKLYLKRNGDILFGLQYGRSTKMDMLLKPNELHSIDLFRHEEGNDRGLKTGDRLAEGIVKDPAQSLFAELKIVHAPDGAWSGKIRTPTTRGAFAAEGHMPKSPEGQTLFRYCIDHARLNGDIPGGLLSRLHELVQEFIRNNSGDQAGDPYAKKMQPLLTRFENKGDWKQADVAALFDDIAVVTTIPMERTLDIIRENTLQRGQALPASLKDANWGEAVTGGLQMAWILEPREVAYHLGSSLKSRVVLYNSGNEPVVFVTRSFHQAQHSAALTGGQAVKMDSIFWTTIGRPAPYRLHPGESCELQAPGIGIGARNNKLDEWSNVRAGTWIPAKQGDDVHFQPGTVLLTGDHNETVYPDWWLKFITERIERDAPLPSDEKEREVVLFRVIADLFGASPTPEEATAFLADTSRDVVSNLAKLLSTRTWHKSVTGSIKSGGLKFRVLPVDPSAATRPRIVMNPGQFNLGEQMRFVVKRRPEGEQLINEANLVWSPPGQDSESTEVTVPTNYDTWAAGWAPGTNVLWVSQKDLLVAYDFTDNALIKEVRYEGDSIRSAPIRVDVREALRAALANAVPQQKQNPQPPAAVKPKVSGVID